MLAVDTNVIVGYPTRDDAEQFAKASALIGSEDVYVCTTVLLETEWVLRRGYRFTPERIIAALVAFAALPRVTLAPPSLPKHWIGRVVEWISPMRYIWRGPRVARHSSALTGGSRQRPTR